MTPKKEAFQSQAHRAGRVVHWVATLVLLLPIGLALVLGGLGFMRSSSPWIGIPTMAAGIALWGYAFWFVFAGRNRLLTCPICGTRGRITKRQWDYYFHCAKCGRSASTGVGVPDGSGPPSSF